MAQDLFPTLSAVAGATLAVVKAQVKDYPLDTCVVTGEKLGSMGDPIDYVFGNRLVRFCCKGCIAKFEANPGKYLAQLD